MKNSVAIDIKHSIRILRAACKTGRPALVRKCVDFSRFSKEEAFQIELFFAKMGVADAQFYVGQCFDYGWGGQKANLRTARLWYAKAVVRGGHPRAAYNLAEILLEIGDKDSRKKAIALLRRSARSGDSDAMVSLGAVYLEEFRKTKNKYYIKKFTSLYGQAAHLRHPSALYNLYLCYKNGTGVKSNIKRARLYLRLAAAEGHKKAKSIIES